MAKHKMKHRFKAFKSAIASMFDKVFGKYTKFVLGLFGTSVGITTFCIFLSLLMCVIGVVIVITKDQLTFVNNIEIAVNQDGVKAGSDLSEYERWVLMANALDRDLIASDFSSGGSYADLYTSSKKTSTASNSTETPAKDVDIFLLADEIYNREEINGDSYTCKIPVELIYSTWTTESSRSQGNGERLTDSEVVLNGGTYKDPIGADPSAWNEADSYDWDGEIGCTYICKQENDSIDDTKRAILGGSAMLEAGKAFYITSSSWSFKDDNTSNLVKTSDEAYTYLTGITLKNEPTGKRGSLQWLPDAFYTLMYEMRAPLEGRNMSTHVTSGQYAMAQKVALEEIFKDSNVSSENAGIIFSCYANALRLTSETSAVAYNNLEATDTNKAGLLESWFIIAVNEGFVEEEMEELCSSSNVSDIFNDNFSLCKYFIGDVNSEHTAVTMNDTSVYAKVVDAINNNTLTGTYSQELKDKALDFQNGFSNPEEYYGFTEVLCSVYHQCVVRMIYGCGGYIKGHAVIHQYGSLIESYYNYEEDGEHKYRLYDVDFGDEDGESSSSVAATGSGPFGLPYYNDDGSVNELAVIAANNLFLEIACYENINNKTITVPDSITVNATNGESATFQLKGGEYPNFWGMTVNKNVDNKGWGQCTWWAKGRAMLWTYENVSTDPTVWGFCSVPSYSGCKYAYISGNGDEIAYNIAKMDDWSIQDDLIANSITSAIGYNHTWWVEAVDNVNKVYYMSHANFNSHVKNGFYFGSGTNASKIKGEAANYTDPGRDPGHGYVGIYCTPVGEGWTNWNTEYKAKYAYYSG